MCIVLLVPKLKWRYESAVSTEMKPSGLTPIHPSEAAKPKSRPCLAAGIFPIKPTKGKAQIFSNFLLTVKAI